MAEIEVRNVSAEGSGGTVNNYTRPAQSRDALGRWRRRGVTLYRGLDAPGTEHTELVRESVTGQLLKGRNNSVLFRDPEEGPVHYVSPDYSGGVALERKSHEHLGAQEDFVRHIASCPACVMHGFVNGDRDSNG
jgi:hypothetical protein